MGDDRTYEEMHYTREEEIANPQKIRPHVVILGAGASVAACPSGDRNGRLLPTMDNFVEVVGLRSYLEEHGVDWQSDNFEAIYSDLVEAGHDKLARGIEQRVYRYFDTLRLPREPTIYDYLVLSLRPKDLIATFNWDPFLYEACWRYQSAVPLPHTVYLHGNVRIGYCPKDNVKGLNGRKCGKCGEVMKPSPLLYPVKKKDYAADELISTEWSSLKWWMHNALALTIFGYGAPETDAEAVALMKEGWGEVADRRFEETEIIDIQPYEKLRDAWRPFIHTGHDTHSTDFFKSMIGNHPRRSCEALAAGIFDCRFVIGNPAPNPAGVGQLKKCFAELVQAEDGLDDWGSDTLREADA